jgi:hypothetical protein
VYNVVWQQAQLEATKTGEVLFSDVPNRISRIFAEKVLQRLHRGSTMLARSVVGNSRFGFVIYIYIWEGNAVMTHFNRFSNLIFFRNSF